MLVSGPVKGGARRQSEKNEAGQFNITQPQAQARPCLRVLAARPGNLLERCFSVSGTERHFQFIGTEEKNDIRNVLQCHYRRQGLEANKAHIKTSFEMMCPRPTQLVTAQFWSSFIWQKTSPLGAGNNSKGERGFAYCGAIAAVDCPAAVAARLAVQAAVPPEDCFSRFRAPGPVAGSPPCAFVRGFSSSFPSAVLASAWLPRV